MALTTRIAAQIFAQQTAALDLATGSFTPSVSKSISLADGTGASQANVLFTDTRTIAASGTDDLDLAGVLTSAFGSTIAMARMKMLYVAAAAANTNNVIVGGAASAQMVNWVGDATDTVIVRPGGLLLLACSDATGYAVTATTGDLLRIANSAGGTSVTYDIMIVGASA